MLKKQSVSIYRLIYRRFLRQSLVPFVLILILLLALFLLNKHQFTTNKSALEAVAKSSFEQIVNQTSKVINQRFAYDKLRLYQLRDTFELLLSKKEAFELDASHFIEDGGFYMVRDANVSVPFETSVYATNLFELHDEDRRYLSILQTFSDAVARAVDDKSDLISAAWVNIDKRYALAYPPIVPPDELSPELDVTQYSFYYKADPSHNPSRDIVYLPLYQEPWAVDAGELGAFLIPLYDEQTFVGVIGLTLTAQGLAEIISKLQLPFGAYAKLLDNEGNLIVTSDEVQSYEDYGRHSFYELHRNHDLSDRTLMKIETTRMLEGSSSFDRSIDGTNLVLNIQVKHAHIFKSIETLNTKVLTIGMTLALVLSIIYIIVLVMGLKRIRALAQQLASNLGDMVGFSSKLGREEGLSLHVDGVEEFETLAEHLQQTHQKLLDLLIKDEQTGLFNRRKLLERLRDLGDHSLLLIRIKSYKPLFKLYGNKVTDMLVEGIVSDLKADARVTAFRLGDDEFALLSRGDATIVFQEILTRLESQTYRFGPLSIQPEFYAGMANAQPLYERASLSLLGAEQHDTRNLVTCNEAEAIKASFEANLEASDRLNLALRDNRIVPYFQPIYNVSSRRIEKFEALARMKEGDAVLAPYHFLSAAANMNKTHEITKVMIQKVFAAAQRHDGLEFNINISFRDFLAFDLVHYIDETQHAYGIAPQCITFELLETDAIEEPAPIMKAISTLKLRGYKIAIDDFGTGHSNFAHLMMLQVDFIKIDGQFVKNITKDPNSATIARTITQFAALVGAKSVAEYVCDEQVYKRIKAFDVDYVQGYYISEPVPAGDIANCIEKVKAHEQL